MFSPIIRVTYSDHINKLIYALQTTIHPEQFTHPYSIPPIN